MYCFIAASKGGGGVLSIRTQSRGPEPSSEHRHNHSPLRLKLLPISKAVSQLCSMLADEQQSDDLWILWFHLATNSLFCDIKIEDFKLKKLEDIFLF